MPGIDHEANRRNTRALTASPGRLLEAKVLRTVTSTSEAVKVQALKEVGGDELFLGFAPWPKPAGKEFPTAGDLCLVVMSDTGRPWIVGWMKSGW